MSKKLALDFFLGLLLKNGALVAGSLISTPLSEPLVQLMLKTVSCGEHASAVGKC